MGTKNKIFALRYLKAKGVDAEEVKQEFVGNGANYDIYNGKTITIERKDGKDVVDTGLTKDEFFSIYGYYEEMEREMER